MADSDHPHDGRAEAGPYHKFATALTTSLKVYSQNEIYAIISDMSQNNEGTTEELYALVHGIVQGVGFRYFVVERASRLGLRGYARNDSNGDVEVLAQGPRPTLERLLTLLQQGPSSADVREVQTAWREPTEHFSGFHVRW